MKKNLFNDGWSFSLGAETYAGLNIPGFKNHEPQKITLPHDFIISKDVSPNAASGRASGFYEGDIGFYYKELIMPQEIPGSVILAFDGVYRNCEIKVNGVAAGEHKYGYTPFLLEISKYLVPGENHISVMVDTLPDPNCRWYSGGGIYRDVYILTGNTRHITPGGIFVSTTDISDHNAIIHINVALEGKKDVDVKEEVELTIYDQNKKKILQRSYMVSQENADMIDESVVIENAALWSTDTPFLYEIEASVMADGNVIDTATEYFGIRTLELSGVTGLLVNGKVVKLYGGCIHHDNGVIGAVSVYAAEERRIKKLKEAGYNAIRTAHNPPSSALLKACDRLGMMVLDEAFDMWLTAKGTYDYHRDFSAHWKSDITDMIMRDRKHPSVIMYSVGNEIGDMGNMFGVELMKELVDAVRHIDDTRPVMVGGITLEKWNPEDMAAAIEKYVAVDKSVMDMTAEMDKMFPSNTNESITRAIVDHTGILDTHYSYFRYESLMKKYPDAVILGTESYADTSDLIKELMDNNTQVVGDFVWTCWDHIGEAGLGRCVHVPTEEAEKYNDFFAMMGIMVDAKYPYRTSNCADFDINGQITVQGLFRKVVWGDRGTYIAVQPPVYYDKSEIRVLGFSWPDEKISWNYSGYEGNPISVRVYSGADEVELFLNGRSLGRKPAGKAVRFKTVFDVNYEPGTLLAVSYAGGNEMSRSEIKTSGKPSRIRAVPECKKAKAGVNSLIYVPVEIIDEDGCVVPDAGISVKIKVNGEGTLLGFGSGIPSTDENYSLGAFTANDGRLLAVVRSSGTPGDVSVVFTAIGFSEEKVELCFS